METSNYSTVNGDAIEPLLERLERWPSVGIEIAAEKGDFGEHVRARVALSLAQFDELLIIEAKVIGARNVVGIGLQSADYLAHDDAERENVDLLVILISSQHFWGTIPRRADNSVALSSLSLAFPAYHSSMAIFCRRLAQSRQPEVGHNDCTIFADVAHEAIP